MTFSTLFRHKTVLLLGLGVSHAQLAGKLVQAGASVIIADKTPREQLEAKIASGSLSANSVEGSTELKGTLDELFPCVSFSLGEDYLNAIDEADIIFRSPGVYWHSPFLGLAREQGKIVTSELEVFFDLCPCKTIAVTGSDGKTTTTTLIAKFLERAGKRVWLGGNIGRALLPLVDQIAEPDIAVVELSSFQLLSMRPSPDVSVVTNISENHLDVHKGGMEEYISAKTNVVAHQGAFSRTVLNFENEGSSALAPLVRGELTWFNAPAGIPHGASVEDGYICAGGERVLKIADILLPGAHNVENYQAAIAATWGMVSKEDIAAVAREFGGVAHRMELVRELDGVRYYNDSISTSPTRTIAGLKAYHAMRKENSRLIAIMGGYDKNLDFSPLSLVFQECTDVCVLLGATADKIEEAARATCTLVLRASSLEEAVALAREQAKAGDLVTLSPASASFDMYRSFEERGEHFRSIVNQLTVDN